jgi:hypothetical protein
MNCNQYGRSPFPCGKWWVGAPGQKFVSVASSLNMQQKGEKTGCLRILIMCQSGATCLPADYCFSEIQYKYHIPKSNQKIVEIEAKSILHTVHCPDHMFSPNYIFNS